MTERPRGFAGWGALTLTAALVASVPAMTSGQVGDLAGAGSARRQGYVSYVPEPASVPAGRRVVIEVHLRIADGFHVNSHRPKSELLIPTAATLMPGDVGVHVGEIEYPAGVSYSFASDPGHPLDVYTNGLVLRVPVTAPAGEHTLTGTLRYQACDHVACYPPKTLMLAVPFTAK